MPSEMDLIKLNALKTYVKDILKMRLSDTSANSMRIRVNSLLKSILTQATEDAKKDDRSTLLPRDTDPLLDAALGAKNLSPVQLFDALQKLNPIELGELVKLITAYLEATKPKATKP